jgi:two-component system nitrogen regulation response regulator GlnG
MPWPGNIRELANTLQKALIFNRGAPLGREDIMEASGRQERRLRSDLADPGEVLRDWVRQLVRDHPPENLFETCTDRFAAILIEEALNATGGNRSQAARLLGLSRPTLHAKIEKYNLIFETSVKSPIR